MSKIIAIMWIVLGVYHAAAQDVYLQNRREAFRAKAAAGSTLGNGLIAHWPIDDGSGTNFTSAVGGVASLVITNTGAGFWTNDAAIGTSSYRFSGVAGTWARSADPNIFEGLTSISISLWFKPETSTRSSSQNIAGQYGSGNDTWQAVLASNEDYVLNIMETPASTVTGIFAESSQDTGHWYHLVGVADGGTDTCTIFIDKVAGGTVGTFSTATETSINSMFAGDLFVGLLDDIRVWNRALTSSEITELYDLGPY